MDNSNKSQVEQLLKIIDNSVQKIQFSEQKEDTGSLFYWSQTASQNYAL